MSWQRQVRVPGRVNLIGDHTDYTGGLVLPMAIDRSTTVTCTPGGDRITLTSDTQGGVVDLALPVRIDPRDVTPGWGRYVAAMAHELGAVRGMRGVVAGDLPIGAGLSSSAALELAVALALGFDGTPLELATAARRAEHRATGVATGIMDQLAIAAAEPGSATLIDCAALTVEHIPVPDEALIYVRFVAHRTLEGSGYSARVEECTAAEQMIGPLRHARLADLERIDDAGIRARARHVISENGRVVAMAAALRSGDLAAAGALMSESHASLRDDYACSTDAIDAAVDQLLAAPGVFGARMTGGGFGGCVVALCDRPPATDGWLVRPVGGPVVT